MIQFVYVIGLHAVQFGNNWMRKIPRTAKLDSAVIWQSSEFFESNYFQIGQACSPKNSLFKAKLNVRAKTIQFILNWTVCKN